MPSVGLAASVPPPVNGDVVVEIPSWNRNYISEGGGSINLGAAIPAARR